MYAFIISMCMIGLVVVISVIIWHYNNDQFTHGNAGIIPDYKGVCLFDIDGTLTTGTENEKVVQYCLDKGYAVGIATAGGKYLPSNLLDHSWMPLNLFNFMIEHDFNTFNNVASGILNGHYNSTAYSKSLSSKPNDVFWPGWFKGVALERTGLIYGIKDPKFLILFDNEPSFLMGVKHYNKDLSVICAGIPCNGTLTVEAVSQVIQ